MAQTSTPTSTTPTVIGYVRVSTSEQADSGAGLAAQRAAIEAEVARKGWHLAGIYEDAGYSAKNLDRPALAEALQVLASGKATALVVSKVDRLSRSVLDFSTVLATAERQRWAVVALDLGLDMSTPTGALMASIVAAVSQYERQLIGQRTRDALAARKAAGVRLGRPRLLDAATAGEIRTLRTAGETLQAIADRLNAAGRTTPTGRPWSPALVRKVTLQAA
jgi:DNA invertase Pin-like site-specific DNA recombinase